MNVKSASVIGPDSRSAPNPWIHKESTTLPRRPALRPSPLYQAIEKLSALDIAASNFLSPHNFFTMDIFEEEDFIALQRQGDLKVLGNGMVSIRRCRFHDFSIGDELHGESSQRTSSSPAPTSPPSTTCDDDDDDDDDTIVPSRTLESQSAAESVSFNTETASLTEAVGVRRPPIYKKLLALKNSCLLTWSQKKESMPLVFRRTIALLFVPTDPKKDQSEACWKSNMSDSCGRNHDL